METVETCNEKTKEPIQSSYMSGSCFLTFVPINNITSRIAIVEVLANLTLGQVRALAKLTKKKFLGLKINLNILSKFSVVVANFANANAVV